MSDIDKDQEKTEKLRGLINSASKIGASAAGAALGLIIAGPLGASIGAVAGAALDPVIGDVFSKVGNHISERLLGPREQVRIGATFVNALDKIQKRLHSGMKVRDDDFFEAQENDRSKAESILEGALLKVRDSYEEKKIEFYSNFLANITFDSSIDFEKGNALLRMLEQLSYRQISMLAYFSEIESLNTAQWMPSFQKIEELRKYQDFYFELMDLYNKQLLQQAGNAVSLSVTSLRISPLGKSMGRLMNVEAIDGEVKARVHHTIGAIGALVK